MTEGFQKTNPAMVSWLSAHFAKIGEVEQVINVKGRRIGATGDGSTDDTSAIQTAIDAALQSGYPIFFPPGTYISDNLVTTSGSATDVLVMFGIGDKSNIKFKSGSSGDLLTISGIGGASIWDLNFDGNSVGAEIIQCSSSSLFIRGCLFEDAGQHSIMFTNSVSPNSNLSVHTCVFIGSSVFWDIGLENCANIFITDCHTSGSGGLVLAEPDSGETVRRLTISNNIIRSTNTLGGWGAITLNGTTGGANSIRHVTIRGNIISNVDELGMFVRRVKDFVISDNIIETAQEHGISLASSAGNGNQFGTITGNIIRECGVETTNTYDGLVATDLIDTIITNNVFMDAGSNHRYHINLDSNCERCVIGGNSYGSGAQTARVSIDGSDHESIPSAGVPTTFADGDTTPDISGGDNFKTANTGSTTITDFDNGSPGQTIFILFGDGNTTIQNNANIFLDSAANFLPSANDTLALKHFDGNWYEISRSSNT